MTSGRTRIGSFLVALALSQTGYIAAAQQVVDGGFVVSGKVRQGMTEGQFEDFVRAEGFEVKTPFPDDNTKQVTLNEIPYWLTFCGGTLTSASWLVDENKDFIKSMDQRVSEQGFNVGSVYVQSDYSDIAKSDVNVLTIKLVRSGVPYSIKYSLFDSNGQVTLEDARYDDTYGCGGDPQE